MDSFKNICFDFGEQFLPSYTDNIDEKLGGGIPLGKVTEIVGQSGVGKTQFCLQLCSNVQLPNSIGGLDASCIYLDCNGGFSTQRLLQICNATRHAALAMISGDDLIKLKNSNPLDRIIYRKLDDFTAINNALDEMVASILNHQDVKLLIIDSIAFHFRYPMSEGLSNISANLHTIAQKLNTLANNWNMAVVVTNQMTTRMLNENDEMIPALGESWTHSCSTSIHLDFKGTDDPSKFKSVRQLKIVKSPLVRTTENILYSITNSGIRDANVTF